MVLNDLSQLQKVHITATGACCPAGLDKLVRPKFIKSLSQTTRWTVIEDSILVDFQTPVHIYINVYILITTHTQVQSEYIAREKPAGTGFAPEPQVPFQGSWWALEEAALVSRGKVWVVYGCD